MRIEGKLSVINNYSMLHSLEVFCRLINRGDNCLEAKRNANRVIIQLQFGCFYQKWP